MGARLFAAVVPPPAVVDEIDALLEHRREAGGCEWRWTRPEAWHLTTVFMASVTDLALDQLIEGLEGVAERTKPFEVGVGGALCFPRPERARTLTLGISRGREHLTALANSCRTTAAHAGADPDGAKFVGHLTLARARSPFDATKWMRIIDSFPEKTWHVWELVLIKSNLMDPGNRFEMLERFTLAYA